MAGEISVRPGTERDHDALWAIFSEVIAGEDTYAMDSRTTREEALAYWTATTDPGSSPRSTARSPGRP